MVDQQYLDGWGTPGVVDSFYFAMNFEEVGVASYTKQKINPHSHFYVDWSHLINFQPTVVFHYIKSTMFQVTFDLLISHWML